MKFAFFLVGALAAVSVDAIGTFEPTEEPTPISTDAPTEPAEEYFPVSFSDYPRDQSCGTGTAVKTSTCFTTGGKSFRFGCKVDDDKIYTDACGANCEDCENQWQHEGEIANVCYDDGSFLFSYDCSAPGSDGNTDPVTPVDPSVPTTNPSEDTPSVATKTCAELGWATTGGDPAVCGASRVADTSEGCSGDVNFFTAEGQCTKLGARLCTAAELTQDEAKGTGCKLDLARVWSSTPCDNGAGVITQAGGRKGLKDVAVACTPKTRSAATRCCSDVEIGAAPEEGQQGQNKDGYEPGYRPAQSHDYAKRDGSCRVGSALKIQTCWTDSFGRAFRFACKQGANEEVKKQSCGTDAQCDPANCTGDWVSDQEVVGKCYASESSYYEYKCP